MVTGGRFMVNAQSFASKCLKCRYRRESNAASCAQCLSEYLDPINSSSCPICLDPNYNPNYKQCYVCYKSANEGRLWIQGLSSIAYYYGIDGALGFICGTYKGSKGLPQRPFMSFPLQALAKEYLSNHLNCIENKFRIKFDFITVIPGHAEQVFKESSYNNKPIIACLSDTRPPDQRFSNGTTRYFSYDRYRVNQKKVSGANILLLDDVYTSGSTLNSAAYSLLNHGNANKIVGFTIARHINNYSASKLPYTQFNINNCIICE